jgi:LmbE family N-acetylglucosaminyl deacetylase
VSDRLTFLAVHAHPDDEASSTGGTFRVLKNQGVRTVLVTCTNGEYGDDTTGNKPDHDDHDPDDVARHRYSELEKSCEILGVDRLVMLGYRDSGMKGWSGNDDPRSFWATPVAVAAERLAGILREERPQVIMTYNEFGFYGHPDHIQANRVTLAALELIDYEPTLYYNAIPDSVMEQYRARWAEEARQEAEEARARGEQPDEPSGPPTDENGEPIRMGTPDDRIGAVIDISKVNDAKFDALAAHHSQISESFWMKMGRDRFRETMVTEWFVRVRDPKGREGVVTDLFADYR